MNKLDRAEALVKAIAYGFVHIQPVDKTWQETFAGNCMFVASTGDVITFFNDCMGYDYIDSIKFDDGMTINYEELYDTENATKRWRAQTAEELENLPLPDHIDTRLTDEEHNMLVKVVTGE